MSYNKPVCECGEELELISINRVITRSKIVKSGVKSRKEYPWVKSFVDEHLRCFVCSKTYKVKYNDYKTRMFRGEIIS